ncbi:MCP four helix bundle domain-containing protein, partial [Planobispora takensis]
MSTPLPAGRTPRTFTSAVRDRGVGTKILTSVVVAVLVGVAVGALGINALSVSHDNARAMYTYNFDGLKDAANLRRLTMQMRLDAVNHAVSPDAAAKQKYENSIEETEAQLREVLADYGTHPFTGAQRAVLQDFSRDLDAYVALRDAKLLPAGRAGDIETWSTVRDGEAGPIIQRMLGGLAKMIDAEAEHAAAAAEDTTDTYTGNRTTMMVALGIGAVLALGLGWATARGILGG